MGFMYVYGQLSFALRLLRFDGNIRNEAKRSAGYLIYIYRDRYIEEGLNRKSSCREKSYKRGYQTRT